MDNNLKEILVYVYFGLIVNNGSKNVLWSSVDYEGPDQMQSDRIIITHVNIHYILQTVKSFAGWEFNTNDDIFDILFPDN